MSGLQLLLGALAGIGVGFTLGLVGGGGSILAVPLLVYLVGVHDPHVAIGTAALAVAANAAVGLVAHARAGHVKWRCASVFAATGVAGALLGSAAGKAVDGHLLLALFAGLMLVVAALMLRGRGRVGDPSVRLDRRNAPRLMAAGAGTGLLAGFFGIGGGFLVVPGLVGATGMPMLSAVGSSLLVVTALGLTTATSYAASGWVAWPLAATFVAGGALGSGAGRRLATRLAVHRGRLDLVLAGVIATVAVYILVRTYL